MHNLLTYLSICELICNTMYVSFIKDSYIIIKEKTKDSTFSTIFSKRVNFDYFLKRVPKKLMKNSKKRILVMCELKK